MALCEPFEASWPDFRQAACWELGRRSSLVRGILSPCIDGNREKRVVGEVCRARLADPFFASLNSLPKGGAMAKGAGGRMSDSGASIPQAEERRAGHC